MLINITSINSIKGNTTHIAWIRISYAFTYFDTHQAKNMKNKRIRNSTLYVMPVFFEYAYFDAHSGCPVVTSDRTHIDITSVSLHSENVYKDNFWVETCIKINYTIVLYSNVPQTLVFIGTHIYVKITYEKSLVFGSFSKLLFYDCNRCVMIHFRTNTLQTDTI